MGNLRARLDRLERNTGGGERVITVSGYSAGGETVDSVCEALGLKPRAADLVVWIDCPAGEPRPVGEEAVAMVKEGGRQFEVRASAPGELVAV